MITPQPQNWRIAAGKWVSVIAMAMLTAYSAHPLFTVVLQVADDTTTLVGENFTLYMLAGLIAVFAGAVFALLRKETADLRIEAGCLWAGLLMWLTIPVMVLIIWLQVAAENGADHGGATAAFFMLLIFGSYCGVVGGVLLVVATVMRRKRKAAETATLSR